MKITELFESKEDFEKQHNDALKKTGFWGAQGAGCIFMAKSTGRFLISHRSRLVEQPGTWGTWGGAIDGDEDPEDAVKREAHEETGYSGSIHVIPLYVFEKGTFRYSNFLLVVDEEFTPKLDWENQGYKWCEYGQWPKPLHFGLVSLLNDAPSIAKIEQELKKRKMNESYGMGFSSLKHKFFDITDNFTGLIHITEDPNSPKKRKVNTIDDTTDDAEHTYRAVIPSPHHSIMIEYDGFHIYGFYEEYATGEKESICLYQEGVDLEEFTSTVQNWVLQTMKKKNVMEGSMSLADFSGRFKYVTNCVNGDHGRNGEAIHDMQDSAREISYTSFVKAVDKDDLVEVFPSYDWSNRPSGLTLKNDRYVRYFKSTWRKLPCVYAVHSAIEYIFTLDGKQPQYDPRYD